jgi:UDP-glucuronate 4-epimerase
LGLNSLGYEIINLGSDSPHSLIEIIKLIEEITGKKAVIKYEPFHKADVEKTWANINKSKKTLKWLPNTMINEGIRKTINWFFETYNLIKKLVVDN